MKSIALFFLLAGIICVIAIPATAPLPTDRISFSLLMFGEIISAGIIIFSISLYRNALHKEFGVVIA